MSSNVSLSVSVGVSAELTLCRTSTSDAGLNRNLELPADVKDVLTDGAFIGVPGTDCVPVDSATATDIATPESGVAQVSSPLSPSSANSVFLTTSQVEQNFNENNTEAPGATQTSTIEKLELLRAAISHEVAESITVANLYLMMAHPRNVTLEYDWVEKTPMLDVSELKKQISNKLRRLAHIAITEFAAVGCRKTSIIPVSE